LSLSTLDQLAPDPLLNTSVDMQYAAAPRSDIESGSVQLPTRLLDNQSPPPFNHFDSPAANAFHACRVARFLL